jgi:hypothetical protein
MSKFLPSLNPAPSLLSLTPQDQCLEDGKDQVPIPPNGLDDVCLLTHSGIRQSVYAGTHILDHLLSNPPGKSSHLAPLMLYRHALELGDSIGTLLRFGSSSTASILLRALFEASLGLEFMLQDNTFQEDRASCYWAFYHIKRLENFTLYDPATPKGKKFHEILDADQKLIGVDFPRLDHSKERKEIEKVLNQNRYKPFWDSFQKMNPKHWYNLCSNAKHLRDLAKLVGRESEYLLLYRMLSESAHASDVFSGVLFSNKGKGIKVHPLRGPGEKIKEVTSLAANYLVWCHHQVLNTYFTKDHKVMKWFVQWYAREYRLFFLWAITPESRTPPPTSSP